LQEAEARAEQARRKAAEGQLAFNPSSGNRTSFKKRKKVLSINCLEKCFFQDTSIDGSTEDRGGEQVNIFLIE